VVRAPTWGVNDTEPSLEQFTRPDAERIGDPEDVPDGDVLLASLDMTHVAAIQLGQGCKSLLRDAHGLANRPDPPTEADHSFVAH